MDGEGKKHPWWVLTPGLRAFYFNVAAHLFNIWTVANIRRAKRR